MKTRRSISKEETIIQPNSGDTPGKRKSLSKVCRTPNNSKKDSVVESINETKLGSSVKSDGCGVHESRLLPNVCSSPVVRVLRSRVVTSENEDEVKNSRTPRKRYSKGSLKEDKPLPIENEETPSNTEEKKTRKSTGSGKKRFSVQNLFKIAELEEDEDNFKSLESCISVKDDLDEPATSLPKTEESKTVDSRIVLQIKIEDKDINQTKEKTPRDKLKEDKSIENEGTPKSEQKKTRKSLGSGKKRSSFQNSFEVIELKESEDAVKSTKSTASPKDDPEETAESEIADSRTILQVKIEDSELDRDISQTKKEKTPRDKLKEDKSIENEGTPKSADKKTRKSLGSGKKRSSFQNSFVIAELEENEDNFKSLESCVSVKDDPDEPATFLSVTEEWKTADSRTILQVKIEDSEVDRDISQTKKEKTPRDKLKKEKSIENEVTPKSADKKTRKSLGSDKKRSSFQNSFEVVELKENEDAVKSTKSTASPIDIRDESVTSVTVKEESETTDSHKCLQEPNAVVEDETSSDLSSIKHEDKIQDAAVKKDDSGSESDDEMSATVSQDSSECLVKRALVKTSRAIREEKKRRSLDISEKKSMDGFPEENSEDSEAHQSEEITEHMEAEGNEQDEDSDDERDSDEDMPEAISFSSGREQMNKAVKMAAEAIRKEKERRKEQQRRRMKMIRTQKEEKEQKRMEKLKSLEMNLPQRLSEDVVNRLPDKPEIPTIKPPNPKKKKKVEGEIKEEEKTESKKNKISKFDDYIPLDNVKAATKFGVVPLEVMQKIPKSASDNAAQFKMQALFGSRIKREPSKNLLAYKQKIGASSMGREMNQQQRFKPYW